jgi:anti-sigma factor RsiW
MKPECLNERDLILLHYGETPDETTPQAAVAHLATCAACQARSARLAADLARLPAAADPDPVVATRIAARVNERLNRRRTRRWLPALGGATMATLALIIALAVWSPQTGIEQVPSAPVSSVAALSPEEDLPDIDFLEDLELLKELDLLRQIEGV